jgi:hypothetical protein
MPENTIITAVPLWEPMIFGNPFYIWLIIILGGLLLLGLVAFKLEVYDKLDPVWGYRAATIANIPLAIVRGMSGKIWLMPVESVAGIFSAMGLPLKWIQTAPSQGQLGRVNTIEVADDWNIVHNVDIDYAIVEAVHKWNEIWAKDHKEGDPGFIFDYKTFEEHLMNGDLDAMFPTGIKLPPFRNIDLHEIRKYLPKWTASHHSGYINAELEKRKGEDDNTKGMELFKWALAAGAVVLICCILGYIIITSAHAPT